MHMMVSAAMNTILGSLLDHRHIMNPACIFSQPQNIQTPVHSGQCNGLVYTLRTASWAHPHLQVLYGASRRGGHCVRHKTAAERLHGGPQLSMAGLSQLLLLLLLLGT